MEDVTFFLGSLFQAFTTISIYIVFLLLSLIPLVVGTNRTKQLCKTFRRDIVWYVMTTFRAYRVKKSVTSNILLRDILHRNVKKNPNKLALIDADTKKYLTFKQVQDLCHKVANVFKEAGYHRGDVVGVFMENRIEYLPIYHGLSMIGAIPALLNTNIRGESLKHCITVCNCKSIIFTADMETAIKEIASTLTIDMYCYDSQGDALPTWNSLDKLLDSTSTSPPPRSPDIKCTDTHLFMFTSGTTGLPKASLYNGVRAVRTNHADWLNGNDTLYCSLPLYHLNSVVFANLCLCKGGTMVVKKKFSARAFIEDCCKYNVTAFNYIGEVCRYVLAQPPTVFDKMHSVRLAIGNGLRGSIWTEFKERFKIGKIIEFYGATEGIFVLVNADGRPGAVGFNPLWFPNRDFQLVKMDEQTGEILRDCNGLAIEAKINEPGQAVVKITKARQFHGYTNQEATAKKIGHDIFQVGDSAFLSGDILVKDEEGYYYFQDRTGDTFRWKGENVSTSEVEGLVSKIVQLNDVCVYGVEVPGTEGKAGMACIVDPLKMINVDDLYTRMEKCLPKYAVPQFLRFVPYLDVTGTFKLKKNKLRLEGYDPDAVGKMDTLFFFDKQLTRYVHLDSDAYKRILNKNIVF